MVYFVSLHISHCLYLYFKIFVEYTLIIFLLPPILQDPPTSPQRKCTLWPFSFSKKQTTYVIFESFFFFGSSKLLERVSSAQIRKVTWNYMCVYIQFYVYYRFVIRQIVNNMIFMASLDIIGMRRSFWGYWRVLLKKSPKHTCLVIFPWLFPRKRR